MSPPLILVILSDVHYASAAEQARGDDYEYRDLKNGWLRGAARWYRHHVWLRYPLRQNGQLDRFIAEAASADWVVANGDYSCDSAFVGLSDDAAYQSATECAGKLRQAFGDRLRLVPGDHEFGKFSLFGATGGMRLASWRRAMDELKVDSFWKREFGQRVLIGVTSSLLAWPLFLKDALPEERAGWEELRQRHLREIRALFDSLSDDQEIILFCHDPTALPFLAELPEVQRRLKQIKLTIIGHLHSKLYLWQSRLLAGMPIIRFLGHSIERMSSALQKARGWKQFHVTLCPSLAGIELLKDGGYLTVDLNASELKVQFHPLRR